MIIKKQLLALVLMALGFSMVTPTFASSEVGVVDLTNSPCCSDISISDVEGVHRKLSDFAGKVTIVTFGFTHCPDVCPTTLSELQEVMNELNGQQKNVQILFVTIDPNRDTPSLLKEYLAAFNPSFIGLRGTREETAQAAKNFRVLYRQVFDSQGGNYSMEHTVGVYVLDSTGKPSVYARSADPKILLPEIERLLKGRVS